MPLPSGLDRIELRGPRPSPSVRSATRLRPDSLASYIVMSARARMSAECSAAAAKVTAPTLADT